jgi:hypothetical protein
MYSSKLPVIDKLSQKSTPEKTGSRQQPVTENTRINFVFK